MSDEKKPLKVIPLNASAITPEVIAQLFAAEADTWQTAIIIGIDEHGDVCLHSSADALEVTYLSQALNLYAQSLTVMSVGKKGDRVSNAELRKMYEQLGKDLEP